MSVLPKSVEKVISIFERLPGIGPKSAARMAYFFLRAPENRSEELANALLEMKQKTVTCKKCFNIADSDPCNLCGNSNRDKSKICVVEDPLDVVAFEKSGVFNGVYFVLGGVVSPVEGIGPEQLRMKELRERLEQDSVEKELEVVIATNPSIEGEATASYIVDMIKKIMEKGIGQRIEVSRLAMGLPTGADLEYADRLTLKRAIDGRVKISR